MRLLVAIAAASTGIAVSGPHTIATAVVLTNASVGTVHVATTSPIVALAATPTGKGFWRATAHGDVMTTGDAHAYGSPAASNLPRDLIVGMTATPTGKGYWLVDRKGAVFSFGDAARRGSMAGHPLNHPIVGMAATPNGQGYWLVAGDGGVFAFNAPFKGSTGGFRLNKPIVGMASTSTGQGYWLVASDGGIFAFNAPFRGSTGGIRLNHPVVGMARVPGTTDYSLVASDGGLFRFPSTSPFYGSAVSACQNAPAVALAMSPGAVGYWIAFADARTYAFSPTSTPPNCAPSGTSKTQLMATDLFNRLNAERRARGLGSLTWDPTLASYATSWSHDMAARGFRHSNIGNLLGPYDYIGENIAAGSAGTTAGSLHVAWMHSDGHRENILAPSFTRVGVGVVCDSKGGIWLTEDFARLTSQGYPPVLPSGPPPLNPIVRTDPGSAC
jgi:uncharacterized protein YkwD